MDWQIALSEITLDETEIEAVTKVLRSKWLTMGAVTLEFEKAMAEKIGVRHAFAVTNATAALHLANLALGIGKGDEVICPALTFVASANATKYTGADVVFADVRSEYDLTVDPDSIRKLISPRTKALTVVHYAGFPCDMDSIREIAKEHHLKIIEDCAHAPLGRYYSNDGSVTGLGSIGDIGCFSFFGNKNMTTGEGGMITTNDDELAAKIKLLRSHGMTTLTYERHKGHASGYDVVDFGYNYRIDELRSALGLAQLGKLEAFNAARRQVFSWYCEFLGTDSNVIVPFSKSRLEGATCHIMPVILQSRYQEIKQALFDARIQTSKHYDLIPTFTAFGKQQFLSKVELLNNIITLPLYPSLKKDQVKEICRIIHAC